MGTRVRLEVDLDEHTATAFAMVLHAMNEADPSARWTPETLAASMIHHVVTDDLAEHLAVTSH